MGGSDASWDEYFTRDETLYGRIASFCRHSFIADDLAREAERYFPKKGIFVDAGSGTGESAVKIKKAGGRRLVALDLSVNALRMASEEKHIDACVQGDLFALPFRDSSVAGIYNLGVMEHFTPKQLVLILNEMHRVLRPGGYAIFFWARLYSPSGLGLRAYEFFVNRIIRRKFWYTPAELIPYTTLKPVARIIRKSKMRLVSSKPSVGTFFIHQVVVCQKP